jgi:hypothetical protein
MCVQGDGYLVSLGFMCRDPWLLHLQGLGSGVKFRVQTLRAQDAAPLVSKAYWSEA